MPRKKEENLQVSIIIKALNEESNIERAVVSALKALKGISGEVILADSLSTDKTIAIAKKHPIRIVQLTNPKHRSCGVGPQLGYQYAKGEFIYILDGDMELEQGFLKAALNRFSKNKKLAGVAGMVEEMRAQNIIFKRRKQQKNKLFGVVKRLEMGGLYRRKAIEQTGWFSNRNLHAYEEAELGHRLTKKGWQLERIEVPGIKHYGYPTSAFGAFVHRWKTGYVKGSGEYLHAAIGKSYFFDVLLEMKFYVGVICWWAGLIIALVFLLLTSWVLIVFALLTGLFLLLFLIKKKTISNWFFSLVSWHYSAIGLLKGLCKKQVNPKEKIPSVVIK